MRDILFRAKRGYDNRWLYGNLVIDNFNRPHVINPQFFYEDGHHLGYEDNTDQPVFINELTIGQFTGAVDRVGNKIFEGDIVHCTSRTDAADMVIIFEQGQFRMVLCERYKEYITGYGYYDFNCFDKLVIGNIYDNPELINKC